MTIREIITEALHYARTCKSLWLFGFFVGIATGGSNGGGGGQGDGGGLSGAEFAPILFLLILLVVAVTIMRFIGEGALIEGVVRARQGGTMTTGDAFRAGWAHWGVLLRIGLLYVGATIASLLLLAAPCVIAIQALGPRAAMVFGLAALLIGVPWLVTLYLVQAFALRIAVLENRHALHAIGKARLFLHGRLMHGLRLIVATFVGTLGFVLVGIATMTPVALVLVALIPVLRLVPVIVLGSLLLFPVIYVLTAMVGTFRSSVWTIGYVTQVES